MTELDLILAVEFRVRLGRRAAYGVAEGIFDDVIETLRKDPRFPRLTRTEYDLLFASLVSETRDELKLYYAIDIKRVTKNICDALVDEVDDDDDDASKANTRRRDVRRRAVTQPASQQEK